jgi:hypothetical protein
MQRARPLFPLIALLALAGCSPGSPPGAGSAQPPAVAAPPPAALPGPDAELAQLQAVAAVDACQWLTAEDLRTVWPDLAYEVHQALPPRLSGYAWDSRCTWWAGVGSIDFAKDTPTHTVEIFVATPVSEAKARQNLASRRETASAATGFQPQSALGADAYAITRTGAVSLYFVRGASEVQLNVSDLDSPNDEKLRKALALAALL